MLLQKEELEQKHLHLLQVVESEKTAKWQYTQQCEELTSEIKKLHAEVMMILATFVLMSLVIILHKHCICFFIKNLDNDNLAPFLDSIFNDFVITVMEISENF